MSYTPQKIDETTISFAVSLKTCYKCQRRMVSKPPGQYFEKNTFPNCSENNFENQAKRAGLVFQSNIKVDDNYICEECKQSGSADFLCAICKKRKPFPKEKFSFGDPPEFLCSDCYETVSAKTWDSEVEELSDKHKYDFE